jgi:hypothetical protein
MHDELSVTPVSDGDPYADFTGAEVTEEYQPYKRPMTYVIFALGLNAAGLLFTALHPVIIVFGWFALGLGIAAVVLARKEVVQFPEAEVHAFVRWGKRTGWLGIIIGPLAALVWIAVLATIGLNF